MAIALWARKNGTMPVGNNNFGRDIEHRHAHGVVAHAAYKVVNDANEATLPGTGPATWAHDGTNAGIFDLHGNLWDHLAGLRVKDGEIQIIKDNDSALNVDESPDSPLWMAIAPDGELVPPGSPDTWKYDCVKPGNAEKNIASIPMAPVKISPERKNPMYTGTEPGDYAYTAGFFQDVFAEPGTKVPMILKELGIYPAGPTLDGGFFFLRNYGERYLARGGSWYDVFSAGMWDTYLRDGREYLYPDLGFRACYVEV